jgi:hypothetical protein
VIDTGLKADPSDPPLLMVNGFLEWRLGNRDAARASLQRVLASNALYPRTANPARFFNYYWGRPAEVGRLLADVGSI